MTRIAFLGTGLMGAPMARRLLGAGHHVTVWNRSPEKAQVLAQAGAVPAADPAQAVAGAEVVFTMLADGAAVADVLFARGVADAMSRDAVLVDTSSIAPAQARDHAAALAARGRLTREADMSGWKTRTRVFMNAPVVRR